MKPIASLASAIALSVVVAACATSGSAGTIPPLEPTPEPSVAQGSPDLTPGPTANPTGPVGPSGSPQPSAGPTEVPSGTSIVRAYFHLEMVPGSSGLVPVLREVPATKAVATAAMNALINGPTENESGAMSSAVPAGTRLLGLSIRDGVATVDLSREFESGGGSASAMIRLGQVVFTLTQFPTVRSVLFQIEGRTVTVFGSEGIVLDGPVARADYEDLLPAIFVDRPAYGAAIGNPARITGSSNVYEATSWVEIRDGEGRPVASSVVTATCGTGCRGTFDVTLSYDVPRAQWGTLRVFDESAKDGSSQNAREYPVWLTPAG
jgi:germination protein M